MLQTVANYKRRIAFGFFTVFYAQLVLPAFARPQSEYVFQRLGASSQPIGIARPNATFSVSSEPAVQGSVVSRRTEHISSPKTTGPTQPEMQSFQSVNTNNMVDLFTGDFSYNIPLLDVGGYPVNIHYNSGITMDQEASWVGLGWNINPGTITRNMRGVPDDFNGDLVTKTMSMKPNKTAGGTLGGTIEIFGGSLSLDLSLGVFHNNYKGWGTETGVNVGINSGSSASGGLTVGLGLNNNSQTGLDISPSVSYRSKLNENMTRGNISIGTNYNSRTGIDGLQMTGQIAKETHSYKNVNSSGASVAGYISFSTPSYTPSITLPFTSNQYGFKFKFGGEVFGLFANVYGRGYGSVQKFDEKDKQKALPAYGYLNFQEAKGNPNALLDFNREKEVEYFESVPHIAVPMYTNDIYTINGEGTGGMFRPYRGDVGFVYDHAMASKSGSTKLSAEIGAGAYFHGGTDIDLVRTTTRNDPWFSQNFLKDGIQFNSSDSVYENVYFKNPGEKTAPDQSFFDKFGGTKLIRADLSPQTIQNPSNVSIAKSFSTFENGLKTGKIAIASNIRRDARDKRTQVITYLKAAEVDMMQDKVIKSYKLNSFPTLRCDTNYTFIARQDLSKLPHHLSEITVLNNDGRRYVYGIPVYNYTQSETSFSIDEKASNGTRKVDTLTGMTAYTNSENSRSNDAGKDGFYNEERTPAYAHSFLLSGIVSPDYVDITGDGISDDDNGEAVKFNYSRIYGEKDKYAWRAPFDSAALMTGMKTDNRDQRGSYSYGERDVWYLNSIESKTMVATFWLNTQTRNDGYGANNNQAGGRKAGAKLYSLKEIRLYTKADFVKNGPEKAKPIKTVHFKYGYQLCPNNPSSDSSKGKLTLEKIWFTYNKNEKGQLNPYIFSYHSNNPAYMKGATDRWGNYKNYKGNPAALTNADFPYSLQRGPGWDSTKAANDAAAWTLNKVKLPSGGEIRVSYESDEYAYVQDKRSMQFFTVKGFAAHQDSSITENLYQPKVTGNDYGVVFIKVSKPVASKKEIKQRYLEGVDKLYFKLFVDMPADRWGKGREYVPFYADVDGDNYGIKGNPSDSIIWIRTKKIGIQSASAVAALQFLRLNLPSKAYPYSEPGDNVDVTDFIKMILTAGGNVARSIKGYGDYSRGQNLCNHIDPARSLVRLNNPYYAKFGGGLRVKRVEIFDNFNAMTNNQKQDALYGQEYDYSTVALIDNQPVKISSGVAAYEPAIGAEENPFHQPISFTENLSALAPANYKYTEEPLGETYYPGPSVGYSRVRVQSIHKDKRSATGFEETTFYTTKDFPTKFDFTPIDAESKKTYNPTIANFLKFFARHDVTLSQGFRVQLNDMNGKVKSQASYAQTDTANPISYTYNYFRVENENSLNKTLNNKVSVIDSASGIVRSDVTMAQDIEVMVDFREQSTETISGSVGINVDVFPVAILSAFVPSVIPLPSSEKNRFRSVAVTKVVQRYGILDSVIHIEKGSKVSTKNMVFDSETGDVVLSRTNNEFDDPVYNFNYPAHWAYTGMGPAYKNVKASWSMVHFRHGNLLNSDMTPFNIGRYIESGDELIVTSPQLRAPWASPDPCSPMYFSYIGAATPKKVWAVDAGKGREGSKGMLFVDKDGIPFSASNANFTIIRSGKRNLSSIPVGAITALQNPIRTVSGLQKIVFDTTSKVVNASAARFKDLWRVDSSLYRKDTVVIKARKQDVLEGVWRVNAFYSLIHLRRPKGLNVREWFEYGTDDFGAFGYDNGSGGQGGHKKAWVRFNTAKILPYNSLIVDAKLELTSVENVTLPHQNQLNSNAGYVRRTKGPWIGSYLPTLTPFKEIKNDYSPEFFQELFLGKTDVASQSTISQTIRNVKVWRPDTLSTTSLLQGLIDDYHRSKRTWQPAIVIDMFDHTGPNKGPQYKAELAYGAIYPRDPGPEGLPPKELPNSPLFRFTYCEPCGDTSKPQFSTSPEPGYYCYDAPVDSFVCKPNIVDSAVNPYRWGILGNWRMDRAYTYYDDRKQIDPAGITDIRRDGEISNFQPFWAFGTPQMVASTDSTRWVWNSEMSLFNRRGYEIQNRDPLGRHNGGQYGFSQAMPVAVGQNTRNRELGFDGFEDYGYKTDTCVSCAPPRFLDLVSGGGARVDSVRHTGLYSLRVEANSTAINSFKVASYAQDTAFSGISAIIDTSYRVTSRIVGAGTGLKGIYKHTNPANGRVETCDSVMGEQPNFFWSLKPKPNCTKDWFTVDWTGAIQPRFTDDYEFNADVDDICFVYINDTLVLHKELFKEKLFVRTQRRVRLTAGVLYNIRINYIEHTAESYMKLYWRSLSGLQQNEIVPKTQLYPNTSVNVTATIISDSVRCIAAQPIKPIRITHDRFSPIQGQQMVVSAWVREEQLCFNGSYQLPQLVLGFDAGSPSSVTALPSGPVIEGWQRIERVITIPATASSMTVAFKSNGSSAVYFDDVRLHPFNSNMKSYVYNSINLRLMAELDENNYATFYEYDDDGTLVRLKKETERGIKTIKETRSALIK